MNGWFLVTKLAGSILPNYPPSAVPVVENKMCFCRGKLSSASFLWWLIVVKNGEATCLFRLPLNLPDCSFIQIMLPRTYTSSC